MTIRNAQRSLSGGEIDPDLWYASDLVPVRTGAASCSNFIVRAKGGVERRPGTEFIGPALSDGTLRLAGFVRSSRQAYLAEYADSAVRLRPADDFDAAMQLLSTPWGADDLAGLQFAQSNDVQWIFSGGPIKELLRTGSAGAYTFSLVDSSIQKGPFRDQNQDESQTIRVQPEGGVDFNEGGITLTASEAVFTQEHVGASFGGIEHIDTWLPDTFYEEDKLLRWEGNVYRAQADVTTGETPPTHTYEQATDPGTGDPLYDGNGNPIYTSERATVDSLKYVYSGGFRIQITGVSEGAQSVATAHVVVGAGSRITKATEVTLHADFDVFDPGHVGATWRLEERDYSTTPKWENRVAIEVGEYCRYNGNVYIATQAGTTSDTPPSHTYGAQLDTTDENPVEWTYVHSGYGIVRITAVTDARTATGAVVSELPGSLETVATWRWAEGAWSDLRGYPAAGALYSSALWAGNTASEPYRLWKSAIEGFDDFEGGTEDDASISRGLYDQRTEAIQWMTAGSFLAIGTEGPEWVARPDESGDVVRTGNLITQVATDEGSAPIPGEVVAGVTIFVDASRTRLVSASYDWRREAWAPRDLSLLAQHILGKGVVDMAYQRRPWPLFWVLLEDGTLGALTYLPDQDVLAWHRHDVGDPVESICVLPVDDGRRDALYLAVRRGGALLIERMADRFRGETGQASEDAIFLDSCVRFDLDAAQTVFAGLDHLEGREVRALVDGKSHPLVTVQGGSVTLRFAGQKVTIGLPYESRYETLPFDMGLLEDWQAARKKRISDLAVAFRDTLGGEIEMAGRPQTVTPLGNAPLDGAPALFTGIMKMTPPGAGDDGSLAYVTSEAWPATITAIFPEYEV